MHTPDPKHKFWTLSIFLGSCLAHVLKECCCFSCKNALEMAQWFCPSTNSFHCDEDACCRLHGRVFLKLRKVILLPYERNPMRETLCLQVQPFRVAQQNSKLKGARVGDFKYVQQPLHLGSLSGNLFDLILRNVKGKPADVELAAESLKKSGFINYFGLQRFGHSAAPTHMWAPLTQITIYTPFSFEKLNLLQDLWLLFDQAKWIL